MNINNLDKINNNIPKEINIIIYDYYKTRCDICGIQQYYCRYCKVYNCICNTKKICCKCFDAECENKCTEFFKICTCCKKYLCSYCWVKKGYLSS